MPMHDKQPLDEFEMSCAVSMPEFGVAIALLCAALTPVFIAWLLDPGISGMDMIVMTFPEN
jgi:hypothetical protein